MLQRLKQNEKSRYFFNTWIHFSLFYFSCKVFLFSAQNCFKTWIGPDNFSCSKCLLFSALNCFSTWIGPVFSTFPAKSILFSVQNCFNSFLSFLIKRVSDSSNFNLETFQFPLLLTSCLVWVIKPDLILQIDFGNTKNRPHFKLNINYS